MTLPPPLTPPESDLRDFGFMPLDVVRFAQSDLVSFAPPEAIVAAILLWGASWHQRPAGSLTNDDRALANLAGYGRAIPAWQAIKAEALRGFVECSDGRLYHPVVADKVREAWLGKLKQRHRTFLATIRQHNSRHEDDQRSPPSFEDWLEQGQPTTIRRDAKPAQQVALPLVSRDAAGNVTRDNEESHARVTHENPSKGQGQGQGQGQGDSLTDDDAKARPGLAATTNRLAKLGAVPFSPDQPKPYAREMDLVKAWIAEGIDVDATIAPTIEDCLAKSKEPSIGSLKFYDGAVRKAHAIKLGRMNGGKGPAKPAKPLDPIAAQDADDPRVAKIRDQLKASTNGSYASWLDAKHCALSVRDGEVLHVTSRSEFHQSYLEEHLLVALEKAATAILGRPLVRISHL